MRSSSLSNLPPIRLSPGRNLGPLDSFSSPVSATEHTDDEERTPLTARSSTLLLSPLSPSQAIVQQSPTFVAEHQNIITAAFSLGDKVEGKYSNGFGSWYGAVIDKINHEENGTVTYGLKYEDGDFEVNVAEKNIRRKILGGIVIPSSTASLSPEATAVSAALLPTSTNMIPPVAVTVPSQTIIESAANSSAATSSTSAALSIRERLAARQQQLRLSRQQEQPQGQQQQPSSPLSPVETPVVTTTSSAAVSNPALPSTNSPVWQDIDFLDFSEEVEIGPVPSATSNDSFISPTVATTQPPPKQRLSFDSWDEESDEEVMITIPKAVTSKPVEQLPIYPKPTNESSFLKACVDFNIASSSGDLLKVKSIVTSVSVTDRKYNEKKLFDYVHDDIFENVSYSGTVLHCAANRGHLNIVKYLVEDCKMDVNTVEKFGANALHDAIQGNRIEIVKYFIEKYPNMNIKNTMKESGKSILHQAIDYENFEITQYLADTCADVLNILDSKKCHALHYAVSSGSLEMVKCLVPKCPQIINALDESSCTPLHYAVRRDYLNIVEYLCEQDSILLNCKDEDGDAPLHIAVKKGFEQIMNCLTRDRMQIENIELQAFDGDGLQVVHLAVIHNEPEILRYLVEKIHCDVNAKCENNEKTPLHYAVIHDKLNIVKCLVEDLQANVNATDSEQKTAALIAAELNCVDILKYFLENVRAINFLEKDDDGMTIPHHIARKSNDDDDLMKYIVDQIKININQKDSSGMLPLHHAADQGNTKVAIYLLEKRPAHANEGCAQFRVPMEYAARNGHLDIIKYMINSTTLSGQYDHCFPALMNATTKGEFEVVKYFIEECHTNINEVTAEGYTMLHFAVFSNHINIVRYLVEDWGVDVNQLSNSGKTPLHYAVEDRSLDMVLFLVKEAHAKIDITDDDERTPMDLLRSPKSSSSIIDFGELDEDSIQDQIRACLEEAAAQSLPKSMQKQSKMMELTESLMDLLRSQSEETTDSYQDVLITQQASTIHKLREQIDLLQTKAFTATIEYQQRVRGKEATIASLRTQMKRNALYYTVDKEMLSTVEICEEVITNLDDSRREVLKWKRDLEKKRREEEQLRIQLESGQLCVICQVEAKVMVLFPCRHLCLCSHCGDADGDVLKELLNKCPICRRRFTECTKIFTT